MELRGNAFIKLPRGSQVLLDNEDGTATWICLDEDVKVCTNSKAKCHEVGEYEVDA